MSEPDEVATRVQRFSCGHENPARNRFCDQCGAAAQRKCPLCESLNREDAKFCGACGLRFESDAAPPVPGSPRRQTADSPPRPSRPDTLIPAHHAALSSQSRPWPPPEAEPENEAPAPWPPRGGWRRDALSSLPADDLDLDRESRHTRRTRRHARLLVIGVLALIAIGAGLLVASQLGQGRLAGPIGGLFSKLGKEAPTDGGAEQASTREAEPAKPSDDAATAPVAPAAPAPPAPPSSAASPSPLPKESTPAPAADRAAQAPPAPERRQLPARSDVPAIRESDPPSVATPRSDDARAPRESEERVAQFLIGQLGRSRAEEKALANAAWYGPGSREHGYWQKVADAIARNPGN